MVRTCGSLGFSLVFFTLAFSENEGSVLDHDLLCLPLLYDCLPVLLRIAVSLKMCSTALKNTHRADSVILFPLAEEGERVDCINIHGIRVSTINRVTRLGITNSQTELRFHVHHDFQASILEGSQTIRVEDQMFLKFFWHQ